MRSVISLAIKSLGGIAATLLALWGLNVFQSLGLDRAGTLALVLGILFTSALGVTLMALVFYSDRTNADEAAYLAAADSKDYSAPAVDTKGLPALKPDGLTIRESGCGSEVTRADHPGSRFPGQSARSRVGRSILSDELGEARQ